MTDVPEARPSPRDILEEARDGTRDGLLGFAPRLRVTELGRVAAVRKSVVDLTGLPGVQAMELVRMAGGKTGMAFDLSPRRVGVILLSEPGDMVVGAKAHRTGRVLDVPVGDALLGRVVDALGRPLDEGGSLAADQRLPVERSAPGMMERSPVTVPLQTGIKVVDALVPLGRGQRELILGDRQTGKTTVALDAILNQRDTGVLCVYCAIGQRGTAVAKVIADLRAHGAMSRTIVVVAGSDDPPGLRYVAPYAATTMAEAFRDRGRDALIVYDDLTRHARAYRELSLLLRRPPGREAFPGDIFFIHSRLLERSTQLAGHRGGGSLTALPVVETQAENMSAYIPTNAISITDGQMYLSPDLFRRGVLPPVDVGRSVSRVGGKAQLSAYRAVASDLRLSYAQFGELESFARFGAQLDEETEAQLARGRRVREALRQDAHELLSVCEQIAVLFAVVDGVLDGLPVEHQRAAHRAIREQIRDRAPDLCDELESGEELEGKARDRLRRAVETAVETVR